MRTFFVAAAMVVLAFTPNVRAQTSPIVQHYRAYLAALDRGDLEEATIAAQAALAASEARDGDGGRTAVLALNLASVQLMRTQYADARSSAERALALAQSGAEGVDPLLAQVVIARAGIGVGGSSRAGQDAATALSALLASPDAQALSDADLYLAAAQLGNWGISNRNFDVAQNAWAIAGAHPAGSPLGESFGLGRARTNEALAIIAAELGQRGTHRIDRDDAETAHALLSEAVRILSPLAQVESPGLELTVSQQSFAVARAWLLALGAKMQVDGLRVPEAPVEAQGDADGLSEIGPLDLGRPRCLMRIVPDPVPRYPELSQVAAVVMFFRINASGEVVHHQVAARAGAEEFADAIERVAGRWRAERLPESAANCRMESSVLQSVRFVIPR